MATNSDERENFFSRLIFRDPRLKIVQDPRVGRGYAALETIPPGITLVQERVFHKHTSSVFTSPPTHHEFVESLYNRLDREELHVKDLVRQLFPIFSYTEGGQEENIDNTTPARENLLKVYQCNGFAFEALGDGEHGGALFLASSYLNHSCDPNCFFFILGDVLHVRSIRTIEPGEELSITYLGGPSMDLYRSTYERRRLLDHHYLFKCLCPRCSQPSQGRKTMDSMIDGILCPVAGCGSVVRWSQPDEESEEIVWKCADPNCSGQREHEDVLKQMMELEQLYTEQLTKAEQYQSTHNTQLMNLCSQMSAKADGFLHKHHRFLVLTYAHLAQFEPSNRKTSQENILKHLEAVRSILGDPHPAIIDDYIFLAMLNNEFESSNVQRDRPWLDEARKRYDIMFGHEGRPFDHHVAGLRRSVSAPRSCLDLRKD